MKDLFENANENWLEKLSVFVPCIPLIFPFDSWRTTSLLTSSSPAKSETKTDCACYSPVFNHTQLWTVCNFQHNDARNHLLYACDAWPVQRQTCGYLPSRKADNGAPDGPVLMNSLNSRRSGRDTLLLHPQIVKFCLHRNFLEIFTETDIASVKYQRLNKIRLQRQQLKNFKWR